jgi:hypothetical protein
MTKSLFFLTLTAALVPAIHPDMVYAESVSTVSTGVTLNIFSFNGSPLDVLLGPYNRGTPQLLGSTMIQGSSGAPFQREGIL